MVQAAAMALPEAVLEQIELLVEGGFENRESLFLRIFETMGEELGLAEEVTRIEELDASTRSFLRDAIEEAFSRQEQESTSWPATTDCDRLRQAFDSLNAQGIVALENCGFTQQEGVHHAARLAVARDELGRRAHDGYCFFDEQDVMGAVAGDGLWLAFGTFREEAQSAPTSPADGAVCPTCNGRGWIQPDPNKLPARCPSHVDPVSAKPSPGLAEQTGQQVAAACRGAGLAVEWDSSAGTRIRLPQLRWQRRRLQAGDAELGEFLESWELEIRGGYTPADELPTLLHERAGNWFAEYANFGPTLLDRLHAHTEQFLERERAREETWADPTVNDRLSAAFVDLRERRLFAAECLGQTIQDGWGYAGLHASAKDRGAVFFHQEDVLDAVNGRGLLLAFGALPVDAADLEKASLALAQEVLAVLDRHGVPARWGSSIRERIRIEPFEWRKRRWTKAPAHERSAVAAPKSPSLWSRVFGRSAAGVGDSKARAAAGQFAEVVRALPDERGFDLRRARRMRAAWKTLGNRGEAQVGHLGLPHVFLPAGEYTTLMPMPAEENLGHERDASFIRGMRARQGDRADAK